MVFCFIHLDDAPDPTDGGEEVFVVVPETSKIAMALPLAALPEFVTLLEEAVCDRPLPQCPTCSATMPTVAVCTSPHNHPP